MDAQRILEEQPFHNPKCIILHCGTNDLEKISCDKDLIQLYEITIEEIETKYNDCRIIVSGLLPRKDDLNKRAQTINKSIEEITNGKENLCYVTHTNISQDDLRDKKHLQKSSVKLFAKNIKAAFFKTTPKTKIRYPQQGHMVTQNQTATLKQTPPSQTHSCSPQAPPNILTPTNQPPFNQFPMRYTNIPHSTRQTPPPFHQVTLPPPPFFYPPIPTFHQSPKSPLFGSQSTCTQENMKTLSEDANELIRKLYILTKS